jgi:hypothetical protein
MRIQKTDEKANWAKKPRIKSRVNILSAAIDLTYFYIMQETIIEAKMVTPLEDV